VRRVRSTRKRSPKRRMRTQPSRMVHGRLADPMLQAVPAPVGGTPTAPSRPSVPRDMVPESSQTCPTHPQLPVKNPTGRCSRPTRAKPRRGEGREPRGVLPAPRSILPRRSRARARARAQRPGRARPRSSKRAQHSYLPLLLGPPFPRPYRALGSGRKGGAADTVMGVPGQEVLGQEYL